MELINTLSSKVGWIASIDEVRPPDGIYPNDLVDALGSSFKFVGGSARDPQTWPTGLQFQDGKWTRESDGRVVHLRSLWLSGGMIVVEVGSTTDIANEVLNAARQVLKLLGYRDPRSTPTVMYQSMLVVDFSKPIDGFIRQFASFIEIINKNLLYGQCSHIEALSMSVDRSTLPDMLADLTHVTGFRIERRADTEINQNRYYSDAFMSTTNHLSVLQAIEDML